jgi:hypothetical protein
MVLVAPLVEPGVHAVPADVVPDGVAVDLNHWHIPMAKKIITWRMPVFLGLCILAGLLSALLGTGGWYFVSWTLIVTPLGVIVFFLRFST